MISDELNAQYDAQAAHIDDLYSQLDQAYGDPGVYYDLSLAIGRAEARLERLAKQLEEMAKGARPKS